jgi:hypothetical protein
MLIEIIKRSGLFQSHAQRYIVDEKNRISVTIITKHHVLHWRTKRLLQVDGLLFLSALSTMSKIRILLQVQQKNHKEKEHMKEQLINKAKLYLEM